MEVHTPAHAGACSIFLAGPTHTWCRQLGTVRERCRYQYDPSDNRCVQTRSPLWMWLTRCDDCLRWCNDYSPPSSPEELKMLELFIDHCNEET